MRYNNNALKNMCRSAGAKPESICSHLPNRLSTEMSTSTSQESNRRLRLPVSLPSKDLEFPMPPLALAPSHHQEIRDSRGMMSCQFLLFCILLSLITEPQCVRRPCKVFDVLEDLVVAIKPLAKKQQRAMELCDLSTSSQVADDEPALRQALTNLIEGSLLRTEIGNVEIVSTETPAGALVIIDDD